MKNVREEWRLEWLFSEDGVSRKEEHGDHGRCEQVIDVDGGLINL